MIRPEERGTTRGRWASALGLLFLTLLLAGGASVLGSGGPSVAEAQTPGQPQEAGPGSAPGGADVRGVSMRPEADGSQAPAGPPDEVAAPPIGLTERGEAALRDARQGEAQPAERPVIEVEAPSPGPSETGPEDDEPQPDAPALGTSFQGMADTNWFPPDPQIAAGPNNLVVATNGGVNILSKRGNSLSSQTLGGFFSALGTEHADAFDPWLAYDPYINRFWLVAVSRDDATLRNDILIGLSNTQDATLGWTLWELDGTMDGSTDTNNWCDYPKIGFDAQAIYVTCNMFAFGGGYQYSKIRIMTKSQFVNNTAVFWWDFWDLREGNSGTAKAFTIQPAQMLGASTSDGEFLVNARGGGGTGSTLDVWRITNAAECCDGDADGPTRSYGSHGIGGYGPSDGARQPGTATQINNGDSRLLYAIWKGGKLSTGHTVACPASATDACGGFTELNVSAFPTISTLNNWALTAGGEDVYYPAASVNAADDKTMVFTVSDPSRFASAAYVGIPSSADCTTCVDGGTSILRSGQTSYVRLDARNRNRWGDYSGASPDPNGGGIWVAGEFAAATANEWGVQVGLTYQPSPPPANDAFSAVQAVGGSSASVGGTNRFATREPNEPDHLPGSGGSSGQNSVWYNWTAPFSGPVGMNTCTSSYDTVLAVYVGNALSSLSQHVSSDNACPISENGRGSLVTFNATAGTTYRIAVAGFGSGDQGTFTLRVADLSAPETAITGGPSGRTNDDTPTFTYGGSDNGNPGSGLLFSYKVDGGAWSPFQPATSTTLGGAAGLPDGPHTFFVKARDAAGNEDASPAQRSFIVDTVKPRVTRIAPSENAKGIGPGTNVLAFFSEAMGTGAVNRTTVKLFRAGSNVALNARVTYHAGTRRATLDPNVNLRPGTRYKVVVTTGARDLAGNQLDQRPGVAGNQPRVWFFTTRGR